LKLTPESIFRCMAGKKPHFLFPQDGSGGILLPQNILTFCGIVLVSSVIISPRDFFVIES
jgi:hypothetical protein